MLQLVTLVLVCAFVSACNRRASSEYLDPPQEHASDDAPKAKELTLEAGATVSTPAAAVIINGLRKITSTAPMEKEPTDGIPLQPQNCSQTGATYAPDRGSYYICDITLGAYETLREWRCVVNESTTQLRFREPTYAFAELAGGKLRVVVNADPALDYHSEMRSQITVDYGANTPRLWARHPDTGLEATLECRFAGG